VNLQRFLEKVAAQNSNAFVKSILKQPVAFNVATIETNAQVLTFQLD
jgi:hypothetical protein